MDKIKKFSVIGIPVKHSLSPQIHKEFARQLGINIQYKMIEPDSEEHFETHVQSFFSKKGFGANITIPFKEQAYVFANDHDVSNGMSIRLTGRLKSVFWVWLGRRSRRSRK